MAVEVIACMVCSKNEDVNYKCPSCRASYCSVSCCREHKLSCSTDRPDGELSASAEADTPSASSFNSRLNYIYETDDTVKPEQLERLKDSQKLKDLLANPHLRRMMEAIDGARDATDLIALAVQEPIFTEMADECLRLIGGEQGADSADEIS